MNKDNRFDRKVTEPGVPEHIRDAAIELTDTLNLCWAAAETVFGAKAKPEHALNLLPIFMARSDDKHRQLLARFGRNTDGEPLPPPDDQ